MAIVHLALGSIWLPFLWAAFMSSATRLSVSTRRSGGLAAADAERSTIGARPPSPCGRGVSGAIAWRSLLTRFRDARSALETFTGAGVGLAAVLVPTLTARHRRQRRCPRWRSGAVGGAVHVGQQLRVGRPAGHV